MLRLVSLSLLAFLADQPGGSRQPAATVQDLRIETRRTSSHPNSSATTEIISIKGARQRREIVVEWPPHVSVETGAKRTRLTTTIVQCDNKRTLLLNDDAGVYAAMPIEDTSQRIRRRVVLQAPQSRAMTNGDVTITIDSVDTQERRRIGGYVARRILTTTTTESASGRRGQSSVVEEHGWYIDLPSFDCDTSAARGAEAVLVAHASSGGAGQVHIKRLGIARRGYPVEEIRRDSSDSERVELIQVSETPLDPSLFDVPASYRPALPLFSGGFDLTKPDTLINRLGLVWQGMKDLTGRFF